LNINGGEDAVGITHRCALRPFGVIVASSDIGSLRSARTLRGIAYRDVGT